MKVERLCHYNIGRVAVWATTVGGGETDDERLGHYDAQKNIRGVELGTLGNAEHQPNETN